MNSLEDKENINLKWNNKFKPLVPVAAFLSVFLIQILFNLFVVTLRSLPDEMGSMSLAAKLAGYDWNNVLSNPSYYYGNASFFLMYPVFKFVKNPYISYQLLLGIGALLRSIPALLACRVLIKNFNFTNSFIIYICGILCSLFTPTRATNIDNEPMLILICWLVFYFIIQLQDKEITKKKKGLWTFALAFVLNYSLFAHTRAIIYTIAFVIITVIYKILYKKWMINIPIFLGSYAVGYITVKKLTGFLVKSLFLSGNAITQNTEASLITSIKKSLELIVEKNGIQGFFDLLASNLWIIFVFSIGILYIVMIQTIGKFFGIFHKTVIQKQVLTPEPTFLPALFCTGGLLISLFGVCVVWLGSAVDHQNFQTVISRGYFYLRYYGNFFGPLMLVQIINWKEKMDKNECEEGKAAGVSYKNIFIYITIVTVIVFYCFNSYFNTALAQGRFSADWFYFFAPFSMKFNEWPELLQRYEYYVVSTEIAVLAFVGIMLLWYKNKSKILFSVILGIVLYQYAFLVIMWDRPFCLSENYYKSSDGIYQYRLENPECFKNIEKLYYFNNTYGPQYIVQFTLPDIPVWVVPPEDNEDAVYLVNSFEALEKYNIVTEGFYYIEIDENEILLLNNEKVLQDFLNKGIDLKRVK